MKQQHFETKANIKKFATQASKGGSIVLQVEIPLTDENATLASCQSKDCVLTLDFDNESIEKQDGQKMMNFEEGDRSLTGEELEESEEE